MRPFYAFFHASFFSIFVLSVLVPAEANASFLKNCRDSVVVWTNGLKEASPRTKRGFKPGLESIEDRVVPTLTNAVYGDAVHTTIKILNANTLAPVPGAAITISDGGKVYPGAAGSTGGDGVLKTTFNNPTDYYGTDVEQVYVQPGYDYHYGYNYQDGQYEYYYGYDPSSGYYTTQESTVFNYTGVYTVTISAPGFATKTTAVSTSSYDYGTSTLSDTIKLSLSTPPAYAASYVGNVYEQSLNRQPNASELAAGEDALRNETADAFATSVLESREGLRTLAVQNSVTYTGAAPAPKLQSSFVQTLNTSHSEEGVILQLVTSAKFVKANGGARAAVLARNYYQTILHRAPSPRELASAQRLVKTASGRNTLVTHLLQSTEYRTNAITQWYQTYTGRTPDAPTTQSLLAYWNQTKSSIAVRAAIIGTEI